MVGVGRKSTTESVTSSRLHSARNGRLLLCAARLAVRVATMMRAIPSSDVLRNPFYSNFQVSNTAILAL